MYKDTFIKDYFIKRQKRGSFKYRLMRRSFEVSQCINQNYSNKNISVLDVGTADGLLLEYLSHSISAKQYFLVGIDISFEILNSNSNRSFLPVQADALNLPFLNSSFDITIAAAVIEHLANGEAFLQECHRVLKKDGLCILTTPVPFFDRIYSFFNSAERDLHYETFSIKKLEGYFNKNGFKLLKVEKFMISPFGFPGERIIEGLMKKVGLGFLLLNQILVGKKNE